MKRVSRVRCGDALHRLLYQRGTFYCLDHPAEEVARNEVLLEFGAEDVCRCQVVRHQLLHCTPRPTRVKALIWANERFSLNLAVGDLHASGCYCLHGAYDRRAAKNSYHQWRCNLTPLCDMARWVGGSVMWFLDRQCSHGQQPDAFDFYPFHGLLRAKLWWKDTTGSGVVTTVWWRW